MSHDLVVTGSVGSGMQWRNRLRARLCRTGHAVALAMIMLLAGQSSHASIAQVPLIIQNQAAPNFTFILDDSGSMQWAFLGRAGGVSTVFTNYVVPRPAGLYGGADYANQVPTFDDSNVHNLITRSSDNNAVYYNPEVVYTPWSNSDGSAMSAADPANALYNPDLPGLGGLDLTVQQTQSATWFDDGGTGDPDLGFCAPCGGDSTFWPITYYVYDEASDTDGDRLDITDYTKYQVQGNSILVDGTAVASIPAPPDAASSIWTAADVQQNFANWFQFARSRILAVRAGMGAAFASQGSGFRMSYGAINESSNTIDGVSTDTLIRGMRDFEGSDRDDFFDFLYGHVINTDGTPLRTSLQDAGLYHERTDGQGPWNTDPSNSTNGTDLECRQSYAILTTDGFWNGSQPNLKDNGNANVSNTDGTNGQNITNPNGSDFQYVASDPYEDTYNNTLADVAMNFWRRDLRTDLDNRVPVNPQDPAFWQHMVTFGVAFGATGTLDPDTDLADLASGAIDWPDPTYNNDPSDDPDEDAERIDDLWHAGVNSRGGFVSANDPQALAQEFRTLIERALARTEGSAAAVATNSGQIDTNTRIYQARFESTRWSGDLLAFALTADGQIDADGDGDIVDDAEWSAAENMPDEPLRNIATWDAINADGVDFEWASLNVDQQTALNTDINGNADLNGQNRLDYLRGDTSLEIQSGGSFRNRFVTSSGEIITLGDIVNSSPFLDTKRDFGFSVLPGSEGADYVDYRFSATYQDRPDMIYVGANDGMLHAFNAGDPTIPGMDPNEAAEEFAFVPNAVFDNLSDLTSPDYTHRFYVDESPRMVDAYIDHDNDGSKSWRSVLIGATGAGGKSVFALDVTDPESFTASNVLWEFTDADLGYTIGRPTIARFPDGNFYAIFGDGYDETTTDISGNTVVDGDGSATAQLFIVDLEDGTLEAKIDTGTGTSDDPNGLSSVIPVDANSDRIVESIYAGDLEGNLWKFDVSSSNSGQWDLASISGSGDALFTATGPNGEVQPIVVRPEVALNPDDGVLTVFFGTGQAFENGDLLTGSNPDVQTFYAIRDTGTGLDRSDLLEQQITSETTASGQEFRIVTSNSPASGDDGWFLDLVVQGGNADGEMVTTEAIVRGERAIFVSQVPPDDACAFAGSSWLYELNAFTGARLADSVFDTNQDGKIDSDDDNHSAIKKDDLVTYPTILEAGGDLELKFMSTASGGIDIQEESDSIDEDFGRGSWREIR